MLVSSWLFFPIIPAYTVAASLPMAEASPRNKPPSGAVVDPWQVEVWQLPWKTGITSVLNETVGVVRSAVDVYSAPVGGAAVRALVGRTFAAAAANERERDRRCTERKQSRVREHVVSLASYKSAPVMIEPLGMALVMNVGSAPTAASMVLPKDASVSPAWMSPPVPDAEEPSAELTLVQP